MRAVILAGGKGTRLRPYTVVLPKPLMPIGEFPILELIIKQLMSNGFDHITLAVNHQAELIQAFFGKGEKFGIKIDYCMEDKPLSTMGPLSLIDDLPDNFIVMNGDVLTDLNFKAFHNTHVNEGHIFTISSFIREQINDYGVLETNPEHSLIGFKEKPKTTFEVSMGVYMVSKKVLDYIPYNTAYGFDNLMLDLINDNKYAKVRPHSGYWLDIGRPDDYHIAIEEFEKNREKFLR